jgi:hypothetical protein
MVSSRNGHIVCPTLGCMSKLRRLWGVKDLAVAARHDYRRFTIANHSGYWEYVPHAHKGCMCRAPEFTTVVAGVEFCGPCGENHFIRPMVFRPCKAPKIPKNLPG